MKTHQDALHQATIYVIAKTPCYGKSLAKHQSRTFLFLKKLDEAIYWTQVGLFIDRIQRVSK